MFKKAKVYKVKSPYVYFSPDFIDFQLLDFRLIFPCYKPCSSLSDWILAGYDFRAVA
jgi:hypothetical protein